MLTTKIMPKTDSLSTHTEDSFVNSFQEVTVNNYQIAQEINDWININVTFLDNKLTRAFVLTIVSLILLYLLRLLAKHLLLKLVDKFAKKSKTKLDNHMVERKVFKLLSGLIPLVFLDGFVNVIFLYYPSLRDDLLQLNNLLIIVIIMLACVRTTKAFGDTLRDNERLKDKPIHSWIQLVNIIIVIFFLIIMFSEISGLNPSYLLTSLGAMSALLILVFKDSILGFVGSVQLATNDMVRIGDWITMSKNNADGDVIEISLTSVKIQNFDNTITSVPTYSFISDSFTNWRGMQDSGGRRIKRSINLKIESVKFCDDQLLQNLKTVAYLKSYISEKEEELINYNNKQDTSNDINLRRLTNIGLLRVYLQNYLANNSNINTNLTLMVRQLQPTEKGIPLEIYCFSKTKVWEEYENLMSDIFDHIMAITPFFELDVFEIPTGKDFRNFK